MIRRIYILIFLLLQSEISDAQPLDHSFGKDGILVMPFEMYLSGNGDNITSIIQQGDGKILVAGANGGGYQIMRLEVSGKVDSSFGTNGRVTKYIASYWTNTPSTILIQNDGKFIVCGTSNYPQIGPDLKNDFSAARFYADGTIDTSFNHTGQFSLNIKGNSNIIDYCLSAALQADGKLVMGGYSGNDIAIIRLNSDGMIDSSFNNTGIFHYEYGNYGSKLKKVVIKPDGKILACGDVEFGGGDTRFLLLQFKPNGHLDSAYGINGAIMVSVGGGFAYDMELQPDGKAVVVGRDVFTGGKMARFNSDGSLDNSFGNGGKVETTISTGTIGPSQLVLAPDGSIFVAGHIYVGGFEDMFFIKHRPDGRIDSSYAPSGIVTQLSQQGERINSMILQQDGKILTAGYVRDTGAYQYAMIRYTPFPLKIKEITKQENIIEIYPNPIKDIFTLKSKTNGKFSIVNSVGQAVINFIIIKGTNTLLFPETSSPGIYNGIFTSDDNTRKQLKIIHIP